MVSLWAIIVRLHNYAGPVVMLAYPLYASVIAIESSSKDDETQWLTYWVLYSFVQLIELALDRIIFWLPFWYTLKLVAMAWLALPQFHGAAFVYENYVKKYMGTVTGGKLGSSQRQGIDQMSSSARASVSSYINEYGPNAFDKAIQSATNEAAKNRSAKRE
ncbi:unnamed protein product [Calypogeia fissa]